MINKLWLIYKGTYVTSHGGTGAQENKEHRTGCTEEEKEKSCERNLKSAVYELIFSENDAFQVLPLSRETDRRGMRQVDWYSSLPLIPE